MRMDGARLEIKRLRDRLVERDFRSGGPPLDENGLPDWDGPGPSLDGYAKALDQDIPAEDLTPQELETRHRLAPFAAVFERLDEKAGEEEPVV